jgi:two-component system response regulator MtrA
MVVPARREAATIVLVEDDPAVARTMADALDSSGYRVWHAGTGSEAKALLGRAKPDLIVLDLMLPDVDGLVLCSGLKHMTATPIVICSATPDKRDAVLGLKLGADDFIAKPFDIYELEARLAAVLRRSQRTRAHEPAAPTVGNPTHVGNLTIDGPTRCAVIAGEPLRLTPTEYRLLSTLAERADHVVTRRDLALKAWGFEDPSSSRTIDVHLRRLRVKLSTAKAPPPVIVAVRGLGYKLSAPDRGRHLPSSP